MCTVGLQEILKAMCRFVELRAVSSYLIAVVAIMKRCRDRHLQLSSTAVVAVKRWRVWHRNLAFVILAIELEISPSWLGRLCEAMACVVASSRF